MVMVGEYTSLAFLLPAATFVGYAIGYLLDRLFHTHFLYIPFLILGIAASQTLHVTGTYTQSSAGKFKTFVASSSSFGAMAVSGSATIAGTLVVRQQSFKALLGQTYPILTSAALTGTFASELEGQINFTGLYYKPTYSASGVTLVVTQATQVRAPKTGPAGTVVTITGSGYLPGPSLLRMRSRIQCSSHHSRGLIWTPSICIPKCT